jgi:RNA polymerase sigma-70 factor, ECF subfamily
MSGVQDDFHGRLVAMLPRLRAQAMALARSRAAAEDLVQDTVANALAARGSFAPGTNFAAWTHRILRNRFLTLARKKRETVDLDDLPSFAFASNAPHEERMVLKEVRGAILRLPPDHRVALLMVVLQGMTYEEVAEATGCAVGTAKSRVFRARRQLQAWLLGQDEARGTAASGAALRPAGHARREMRRASPPEGRG